MVRSSACTRCAAVCVHARDSLPRPNVQLTARNAADPQGLAPPPSATASPGHTAAAVGKGLAAVSNPPDVWHDIIGPAGFLQQFENQLFADSEKRGGSAAGP